MQKILLTFGLVLCLLSTYAADYSIIAGKWNRANSKEVKLYRIVSGKVEVMASCSLQHDNSFGFAFEMDAPGFYVIGNGVDGAFSHKYTFYFKPGDRLNVVVDDSTYVLTGKNTPENEALTKWHDLVVPLEWKSIYFAEKLGRENGMPSTYVDFFPKLEAIARQAKTFQAKTGNSAFNKDFEQFRYYDLVRFAAAMLMTPRTAHPTDEDFIDFYKEIDPVKITASDAILRYPFSVKMLSYFTYLKAKFSGQRNIPQGMNSLIDNMLSFVINPTLKGEAVLVFAEGLKDYDSYQDFEKAYGKYITTDDQKERMTAIQTKLAQLESTQKTINFTGTDLNDKVVSVSDFKGKVVIVDVWATWCGPCRGEIPFLKKLEEEYHGKDVVFLSISLDEAKDKQKWIDFIKKEDLKGVQLFGGNGWNSDVARFYNIKGIPRFMFFDKKGNIVTADAPRPSDPSLKVMIEKYLNN